MIRKQQSGIDTSLIGCLVVTTYGLLLIDNTYGQGSYVAREVDGRFVIINRQDILQVLPRTERYGGI